MYQSRQGPIEVVEAVNDKDDISSDVQICRLLKLAIFFASNAQIGVGQRLSDTAFLGPDGTSTLQMCIGMHPDPTAAGVFARAKIEVLGRCCCVVLVVWHCTDR